MLTRRAFAQIAAASVTGVAQAGRAVEAQHANPETLAHTRAAEAQALRKFAERTSPRGLEAASSSRWRRDWAAFEQRANTLSDTAYVIGLRRLLGWFREGHTTIVPFEFLGSPPRHSRTVPGDSAIPSRPAPSMTGCGSRRPRPALSHCSARGFAQSATGPWKRSCTSTPRHGPRKIRPGRTIGRAFSQAPWACCRVSASPEDRSTGRCDSMRHQRTTAR